MPGIAGQKKRFQSFAEGPRVRRRACRARQRRTSALRRAAVWPPASDLCDFDLLIADGTDLRPLPLRDRKAMLAGIGRGAERWIALTNGIVGEGRALYRAAVDATVGIKARLAMEFMVTLALRRSNADRVMQGRTQQESNTGSLEVSQRGTA